MDIMFTPAPPLGKSATQLATLQSRPPGNRRLDETAWSTTLSVANGKVRPRTMGLGIWVEAVVGFSSGHERFGSIDRCYVATVLSSRSTWLLTTKPHVRHPHGTFKAATRYGGPGYMPKPTAIVTNSRLAGIENVYDS